MMSAVPPRPGTFAMLKRLLTCLALLLAAPLAFAQAAAQAPAAAPATYTAGKAYVLIDPPQPTASGNKVEVVEVFSYGCIHCANFQPLVDAWKKQMPAQAAFSYLPALFRADFAVFGRAFFTAQVLGIAEKSHDAMFKAVFVDHRPFRALDDFAQFYSAYGVKAEDFVKAATSFEVESKMRYSNDMVAKYGVDGTPTMIVAGKYRVTGESANGYDKVFAVVDYLIAKEAAAKR
jgi:thiol:disulfide interchange protein DsbA